MEILDSGYWNNLMKLNWFQWWEVSVPFTIKMCQISLASVPLSWGCSLLSGTVPLSLFLSSASLCWSGTCWDFSSPSAPQPCLSLASSTLIHSVLSLWLSAFPFVSSQLTFPTPNCVVTWDKKIIKLLWYLLPMYSFMLQKLPKEPLPLSFFFSIISSQWDRLRWA